MAINRLVVLRVLSPKAGLIDGAPGCVNCRGAGLVFRRTLCGRSTSLSLNSKFGGAATSAGAGFLDLDGREADIEPVKMLCDICKEKVATVHLTQMVEGKT